MGHLFQNLQPHTIIQLIEITLSKISLIPTKRNTMGAFCVIPIGSNCIHVSSSAHVVAFMSRIEKKLAGAGLGTGVTLRHSGEVPTV